jgi:hypothetical protein
MTRCPLLSRKPTKILSSNGFLNSCVISALCTPKKFAANATHSKLL